MKNTKHYFYNFEFEGGGSPKKLAFHNYLFIFKNSLLVELVYYKVHIYNLVYYSY